MEQRNTDLIVREILEVCRESQSLHEHRPSLFEDLIIELNSDKMLLARQLCTALQGYSNGLPSNIITSQQIILGQNANAAVRINIWPALHDRSTFTKREKVILSYEEAHDHNFDFLTIGHFGPGYTTEIYTYEREDVLGFSGEEVNLQFYKNTQLKRGNILWFKSGKHVHTQEIPNLTSASINIVFKNKIESSKPQFFFDINNSKIKSLTENTTLKQLNFLDMCRAIPTELSASILKYYANKSDNKILIKHAKHLMSEF